MRLEAITILGWRPALLGWRLWCHHYEVGGYRYTRLEASAFRLEAMMPSLWGYDAMFMFHVFRSVPVTLGKQTTCFIVFHVFWCIKNTHVGQSVRLSKCAMKHHQENEVYWRHLYIYIYSIAREMCTLTTKMFSDSIDGSFKQLSIKKCQN